MYGAQLCLELRDSCRRAEAGAHACSHTDENLTGNTNISNLSGLSGLSNSNLSNGGSYGRSHGKQL